MSPFIILLLAITILAALGGAALMWGEDSRFPMADDHRR